MSGPVTILDLEHAKQDTQTISDVTNGASGSVTSRLGLSIKTLNQAIMDIGFSSIVTWSPFTLYDDFTKLIIRNGTTYTLKVVHTSTSTFDSTKFTPYFPGGLGTAATRDVIANPTDTTAGRVLTTGAGGLLGDAIQLPSGTSANSVLTAGFYYIPSMTDAPLTAAYFLRVSYVNIASGRAYQEAYRAAAGTLRLFAREMSGGIWSPWQELYHTGNLIGTVSQSGGVPTGAVIQRGSNANGEFVRFADGTQICWHNFPIISTTIATDISGVFKSAGTTWNFPVGFVDGNISVLDGVGRSVSDSIEVWGAVRERSSISISIRAYSTSSSPTMTMIASPIAIGRWY